ncbi:DUF2167 domain-containing protein [Hymenobacter sp. BT664]|uniref:DUF2167 domain-containing protein n=1 Tax=Hymenobacter montanus TaxID=2771359 RepID=A0A927GIF9_9BACT|nr:DUF2167 domain-containing protein [Hymenobacter montanus]MBD2767408.1 DUF2167 domain-containing protein [Hymenobacter montanus]
MKQLLLLFICLLWGGAAFAASSPVLSAADSVARWQKAQRAYVDSIDRTLHYQQGHLKLPGGVAELTVPRGFRFLDSAQTARVLTTIWGNPKSECLGMLLPEKYSPAEGDSWAYVIRYDPMGYVKDSDAEDIDYNELLEEMQNDTREGNKEREAAGFEPVYLLGWAANPFYDQQKNALHWAKSLRFGNSPDTTLNYNVRLLGRKGVLVLNAVGVPRQLSEIRASIPGLLANVTFAKGERYADFNPSLDEVAAYTIGGLVAGKVLAKVGLFALILKFWKLGLLALGGAWAALKRFLGFGAKES